MPQADRAESPVTSEIYIHPLAALAQQLRWMIGIRLVAITSVVVPYFLLQISQETPPGFDFLYLLAGITYLASLGYILLLSLLRNRPEIQAYIQFVGDLLLITGLVYHFGGVSSPFSILYFIVIIVSSALLRRRAGLTVGATAWVMYAATVLLLHLQWIPPSLAAATTEPSSPWRITYSLLIHLVGFFAVAVLTSRLAQSITRAEVALQTQREDLADLQVVHRDVIESIPSGLITSDPEDRITSANRAAQEILGRPERDLLGRKISDIGLFSPEDWKQAVNASVNMHRSRRELLYRRNGTLHYIGYSLTHLASADGAPSGHVLIFQDLSDWRKLQEEVRIKDRMAAVGELAAGIAHEVGNPLAAVSGSAQMLSASLPPGSGRSELLDIILKESQRLDRTIKSFLKFARPRERANVRFDICQLLTENLQLLRHSPEVSREHELKLELDPPSTTLVADPDQVSQIFWNLARNALKAMPDGGSLTVAGTRDDHVYRLRFTDTGHGMTEEERANLFHPFQSFFDSGTGIGMAIVYRIVQQHDGRLSVDSRPGGGTTVTVELPLAAAPAAAAEVEE